MPRHHSLPLHDREATDDLVVSVAGMEAHHIVRAAESNIASSKRVQLPVLAHLVSIEMSPNLLPSPPAFRAKMCVDIGRYRDQPERFRVERQLLHDSRAV